MREKSSLKLSFLPSQNYDEEENGSNEMSESGFGSAKGNYNWTESRLKRAIQQHDVPLFKDLCGKLRPNDIQTLTILIHEAVYNRSDVIAKEMLSSLPYPSKQSYMIEKIALQGIWTIVNRLGKTVSIVHCLRLGFSSGYLGMDDFLCGMRIAARKDHKAALNMYFQKADDFEVDPKAMNLVHPFVSYDLNVYRILSDKDFRKYVEKFDINKRISIIQEFKEKSKTILKYDSRDMHEAQLCLRYLAKQPNRQRRYSKRYSISKQSATLIKHLDLATPLRSLQDRVCVHKRRILQLTEVGVQNYISICDENSIDTVIANARPSDILDIMDNSLPLDLLLPCESCLVAEKTSPCKLDKKSFKDLLVLWLVHSMDLQELESILLTGIENDNIILVAALICHYPDISHLCLHTCFQQRPNYVPVLTRLIANMFKRIHQNKFDYLDVYPSWEKRNKIILVVIYGYGGKAYTGLSSEYHHIKLVWRNILTIKEEPYRGTKRLNKKYADREEFDDDSISQLFQKHSNLNYIVLSDYKCIRHRVVPKQCIALYCTYKRYVPFGEHEFPRKIKEMETDVREGLCFLSNGPNCCIGDVLYTKPDSGKSGTLGGFVSKDRQSFILTCAHTVFSDSELCGNISCSNKTRTIIKDNAEVGHPICASFSHGNKRETSIDASLIELSSKVKRTDSLEYIEPTLCTKGFAEKSSLKYEHGLTTSFSDLKMSTNFIKIGAETGLTKCCPTANRSHVRINSVPLLLRQALNDTLEHSDRHETSMDVDEVDFAQCSDVEHTLHSSKKFMMHNQIEIDFSHERESFSKLGDSGALVFVMDGQENLSCIGLMIGLTSNKTAIVTPIRPVLEKMNKILHRNGPPLKLSPFEVKIQRPVGDVLSQQREDVPPNSSSDQQQNTAETASVGDSQNIELVQQIGLLLKQSEDRTSQTSQQILQNVTEIKNDLSDLKNRVSDLEVKHISTEMSLIELSQDVTRIERQQKDS